MQVGRIYFPITAPAHVPVVTGDQLDLSPSFVVDTSFFKGATFVAPNVGAASTFTTTFAGAYVAGDTIRLTITSNATTSQKWIKSYFYTVVTGDTVTSIALAFKNKIVIDATGPDCPYFATSALGVLTVTAKNNDKRSLFPYIFETSLAGTAVLSAVTTTISEGQPQDLIDRGVVSLEANVLPSWDTVRILYQPFAAEPTIDSVGAHAEEIFWYGTPGTGAALAVLINAL